CFIDTCVVVSAGAIEAFLVRPEGVHHRLVVTEPDNLVCADKTLAREFQPRPMQEHSGGLRRNLAYRPRQFFERLPFIVMTVLSLSGIPMVFVAAFTQPPKHQGCQP